MQANPYTRCTHCYRFGHASPRCPQKPPTSPYCALHHTRLAHRCQTRTCPKGSNTMAVPGGCPTSTPHFPNSDNDPNAFSGECRARPMPPPRPEAPPPSDDELSDASSDSEEAMDVGDDGRPAPSTPESLPNQSIDRSTPRPHQSRDAPTLRSGSQAAPTGRGLPLVTPSTLSGPSWRGL